MNSMKETFRRYLSEKGLKSTLQRDVVLETFLLTDRHVTVDDLCQILRDEQSGIGHATVYRTLKLLAESGIAREIKFGDGFTRYERVTVGAPHDHLICTSCANITEFNTGAIKQLKDEISRSHGFIIETLKLELRGVCKQCQGK